MKLFVFTKNGWLTATSQFSTDLQVARSFSRVDAIATCLRFKSNGVVAVPVREEDLESML